MARPVTVLLADDHSLVRGSLASWLRNSGISVVSEVGNADAAVTEAIRLKPDVVVLDIDMPGLQCFDAARAIRARCPGTRVLFLSAFFNDRFIEDALRVEASGYITKGEPPQAVVQAIHAVMSGGVYFSPEVQSRLVIDGGGVRLEHARATRSSTLTTREVEVLRYVARGMAKKEIAATMHLSVKTIDNHCTSLMNKLDIHDRVELARFAIREGLAEP
ncbi:MAG: response regulator transcription factor [Phycisphaeraceae bacterium]|nr:MAG: response regulator transcription factor [Phycisphaeraceae bacterium]